MDARRTWELRNGTRNADKEPLECGTDAADLGNKFKHSSILKESAMRLFRNKKEPSI